MARWLGGYANRGPFFEPHAIAPGFLGAIERRVGGFEHELRRRMARGLLADADAHADAERGPIGRPRVETRARDGLAERLGIRCGLLGRAAAKDDEKLFAAVAKCAPAAAHLRELDGHGLEQLVAGVVAVRVVESLEVIDV